MMNAILARVMQNKHTSSAAAVYVGSLFLVRLLKIWVAGHDAQFDSTEELIKGAAVGYGLLMAGDASQSAAAPGNGNGGALSNAATPGTPAQPGQVITRHTVI